MCIRDSSRFDRDFSRYDAVLAFQDVDLDQFSSELAPARQYGGTVRVRF